MGQHKPLRRRTPLRVIGKKVRRDQAQMREARKALLERTGGRCEGAGFSPLCTGVGVDPHHVIKRSQGGSNDPSNLKWLCRACHERVDADRPGALAAGLLKPGWAK